MAGSSERVRRYRAREQAEAEAAILREFEGHLRFVRRFSDNTVAHYGDRVAAIARRLHEQGSSLRAASTKELLAVWPKNGGARWHNGVRQALVAFYLFQGRRDNPAKAIPRAKATQTKPRPYTAQERARYLSAALELGPRHYALACLGVYAGLRIHETAKLAWRDVDRALTVLGKGRKERVVPMHPALREALEVWRGECPSSVWVFPPMQGNRTTLKDRPVVPNTAWTWHKEVIERAGMLTGVPRLDGFHRTRHTAATEMYRSTKNLLLTQRFLGHASVATTVIYTLVEDDELSQAVEGMFS